MEKSLVKISMFFICIASVCLIVGIATPYWITDTDHYQGLWKTCYYDKVVDGKGICASLEAKEEASWLQGVRVVLILAMVCAVLNVILLFFYIRRDDGRANLQRIRLALLVSLVSFILCMVGIILYAEKAHKGHFLPHYKLAWSFILTTISGCILAVVVIPLVMEIKNSRILGTYESI